MVDALGDDNAYVRSAAYYGLKRMKSEHAARLLEERLAEGSPVVRITVARTLQALGRGDQRPAFVDFLVNSAEATSDYDGLDWAVAGLRNSLLDAPATEIAGTLRHPVQEVRLAGIMASIEHADRAGVRTLLEELAKDQDTRTRTCAARAKWALGLVVWAEGFVARAREALEKGDLDGAERVLNAGWANVYTITLGMGLAQKYRIKLERVSLQDEGYGNFIAPRKNLHQALREEITLRKASRSDLVSLAERWLAEDSSRQQELRDDPRFASLHDDYRFRVLTGMEPRRAIEIALK